MRIASTCAFRRLARLPSVPAFRSKAAATTGEFRLTPDPVEAMVSPLKCDVPAPTPGFENWMLCGAVPVNRVLWLPVAANVVAPPLWVKLPAIET